MIADLLEKAPGMSNEDILLEVKASPRGELLHDYIQLHQSCVDLRRELGHPHRRVSDGDGPLSREYDLRRRLTEIVKVAMSRKCFEKPPENARPAGAVNAGQPPSEGVNPQSTEEEDLAAANVRDKADVRVRNMHSAAARTNQDGTTAIRSGPISLERGEEPGSGIDSRKAERKRLRDEYKAECKRAGVTVTDEMIAKEAKPPTDNNRGWTNRTHIQKWLGCDPKYDGKNDELIRSVFVTKPHLAQP